MESIGLPNGWEGVGVASLFLLLLFMIISGRVYFKWQVDKMFKDKDQIIETQSKIIEELVPPMTKLLEKMNEKADLDA